MIHDSDFVEHGSQTSIKSMVLLLAGAKLDMFYCDSLLVVYAFINTKRLPLPHLRKVLDIAIKTSLQTKTLYGTQDVVKVQAGKGRSFAQVKALYA